MNPLLNYSAEVEALILLGNLAFQTKFVPQAPMSPLAKYLCKHDPFGYLITGHISAKLL